MRLRLLDLFCKAGGAAMGYHRAGFEVVGVDCEAQPHYPFEFHRADAIEFWDAHGRRFHAIHASPLCQGFSQGRFIHPEKIDYPNQIAATRAALLRTGKPYVLENVPNAPLGPSIMLCGLMFGLGVLRHRWFESNLCLLGPAHPKHPAGVLTGSAHGYSGKDTPMVCVVGHNFRVDVARRAMGIDWMNRDELSQAIPPAYTEFIGKQLLRAGRSPAEGSHGDPEGARPEPALAESADLWAADGECAADRADPGSRGAESVCEVSPAARSGAVAPGDLPAAETGRAV